MKRASYREAVKWIASNDDCCWVSDPGGIISVTACLVADLFGVSEERVTEDLRRALAKED